MTLRLTAVIFATTITLALSSPANAQTSRMHVGPRVSYQFDLKEFGVGAQFSTPIATNLEFYPSADVFFVNVGSFWDVNADLKYRMAGASTRWLYLGGGLNLARSAVGDVHHTHAGLNLFVGAESRTGRIHPFGEFRFTASNASSNQLALGLNFTLGKP